MPPTSGAPAQAKPSPFLLALVALLAAIALTGIVLALRTTTIHHRWSRQTTDF